MSVFIGVYPGKNVTNYFHLCFLCGVTRQTTAELYGKNDRERK
jgi:hypothetical protein